MRDGFLFSFATYTFHCWVSHLVLMCFLRYGLDQSLFVLFGFCFFRNIPGLLPHCGWKRVGVGEICITFASPPSLSLYSCSLFCNGSFFFFSQLMDLLFAVINWIISNHFVFYSALFSFPKINLGAKGGIAAKSVFRHWRGWIPGGLLAGKVRWRWAVIGMRSDWRISLPYSLTVYCNKMNESEFRFLCSKRWFALPFREWDLLILKYYYLMSDPLSSPSLYFLSSLHQTDQLLAWYNPGLVIHPSSFCQVLHMRPKPFLVERSW